MTAPSFPVNIDACRRGLRDRERERYARREARRLRALEAVRRAAVECAPRYPSVVRVYLFGSVLRSGAFRTVSDVDVAVDGMKTGVEASEYFDLFRDLEQAAPEWTIDLREMRGDSPLSRRVRAAGMLVHERENTDSQG